MPRYFFKTRIGDDTIPDVEGEELRDADHAWEVAKAMIVDLLEEQAEYPNILTAALVVTDQKGDVVLAVNSNRDSSLEVCQALAENLPAVRVVSSAAGGWGRGVKLRIPAAPGARLF